MALTHLERPLEDTLPERDVVRLEKSVQSRHVGASHEGPPVLESARVEVVCVFQLVLVVPVRHSDEAEATDLDIDAQLGDFLLAQVVLNVHEKESFVVRSIETRQWLVESLEVVASSGEAVVQALEVSEEVVAQPLEGLLVGVLEYVVFPDEAVLRVVQRVELVEEQALVAVRRPYEVHDDLELSQGRVASLGR